jgi:hypothetical protein
MSKNEILRRFKKDEEKYQFKKDVGGIPIR